MFKKVEADVTTNDIKFDWQVIQLCKTTARRASESNFLFAIEQTTSQEESHEVSLNSL